MFELIIAFIFVHWIIMIYLSFEFKKEDVKVNYLIPWEFFKKFKSLAKGSSKKAFTYLYYFDVALTITTLFLFAFLVAMGG